MKAFLAGHQQIVRVTCKLSIWETLYSEVTQSIVLGPMFFLLYVNNLLNLLSRSVFLYADSVKIWRTTNSKGDSLEFQNDLSQLFGWSRIQHSAINVSKRNVMYVGHQGTEGYTVNDSELPIVRTYGDLEAIFNQELKTENFLVTAAKSN